jgi:hypothetical protein
MKNFEIFRGRTRGPFTPRGGKRRLGRVEESREVGGRGWGDRKGRGGREGLKERVGKERGEKGGREGERNWTLDVSDRSTPLHFINMNEDPRLEKL